MEIPHRSQDVIQQAKDIANLQIDIKLDESSIQSGKDKDALKYNEPNFVKNPDDKDLVKEATENFQPSILIKRQTKGMQLCLY